MLQRNGRITNLSAYNTIPRYNRSSVQRNISAQKDNCGCGCDAQYNNYRNSSSDYNTAGYGARSGECSCEKEKSCNECGYSPSSCREGYGHNNCNLSLAITSIEMQTWCNIYDLEQGFCAGTIFRDLDLPFCGMRGVR